MKIRFTCAISAALVVTACAGLTRPSAADPAPQTPATPAPTIAPANGPLWSTDGGGVLPALGSVGSSVPCQPVSLSLQLDHAQPQPPAPKLIGKPASCRKSFLYMGYLRSTLFIEGLDASGARLFVAMGDNPRHQDLEVPPPPPPPGGSDGGGMSWHSVDTPTPLVSTFIQAPITPDLARLRWYDVDENFQPRLMGETAWTGVAPPAP